MDNQAKKCYDIKLDTTNQCTAASLLAACVLSGQSL